MSNRSILQAECDAFNAHHPIGTPVRYWTGPREGLGRLGRVRFEAMVMGNHTAVVYIGGVGAVALTHVQTVDDCTPPDFTLPEAILDAASDLRGELHIGAYDLAERLQDLGLPADQASTVVVDWLVELACAMAMAVAVADGRPPQRRRWQEVTGEKFDRVYASFAPVIDGRQVL